MCALAIHGISKLICSIVISYILFYTKDSLADSEDVFLNKQTNISCNDSLHIIHIINVTSVMQRTQCMDKNTNSDIKLDTVNYVEKFCGNKTACQIKRSMVSDREPYLNEFGYYNLSYTCNVQECGFDKVSKWCEFSRNSTNATRFGWKRRRRLSKVIAADHTYPTTNSSGLFAFVSKKSPKIGDTATLKTVIDSNVANELCLSFWIWKTNDNHVLEVHINTNKLLNISEKHKEWTEKLVRLDREWLSASNRQEISFIVSHGNDSFDGHIAIDDFKIVNRTCQDLEPKGLCARLTNDSVIDTCPIPDNISLSFEPEITECEGIRTSLLQEYDATAGSNASNISEILNRNPECFWLYDVQIHFTCIDKSDPISLHEMLSSSAALTGAAIGSAVVVVSIVVAVITFVVIRKKRKEKSSKIIRSEQQTSDYIGHQNVAFSANHDGSVSNDVFEKQNNDHQTYDTVKDSEYDYANPMQEHTQNSNMNSIAGKSNENLGINKQSDAMCVVRRSSDQYDLVKPEVHSNHTTYVITDTEYTIAGHNYHKYNETNFYSHSMDTMYDSSNSAKRENANGNQYDHFVGEKTDIDL